MTGAKMKTSEKTLIIKTVAITISIPIIIIIALNAWLYWWPALNFPKYVHEQLSLPEGSLEQIETSKIGYDKRAVRDLVLVATIKSKDRDALLKKGFVFDNCHDPCRDKDIGDKYYDPKCDGLCAQEPFIAIGKDTDRAEDVGEKILGSKNIYCASQQQKRSSRRFRDDDVCLSPDSNKIWYSSYEPDF